VNEQIVAEAAAVVEAFQEPHVLPRNTCLYCSQRILVAHAGDHVGIDSIAPEALGTAERAPPRDQIHFAAQNAEQYLFVISEEEDRSNPRSFVRAQALDHLCGIRAPIDEVADEHHEHLACPRAVDVFVDLAEELLEEVKPTVNVADSIDTPSASTRGAAFPSLSETEHPAL
jgi:hypothetical protein